MKAPKAPDPVQTATTQSGLNRDTAITQYMLNATNQVTPYGNLTYKQTGSEWHPSRFGDTYYQGPGGIISKTPGGATLWGGTGAGGMIPPQTGGTGTGAAASHGAAMTGTHRVPIYRTDSRGDQHFMGYRDEPDSTGGAGGTGGAASGWSAIKGFFDPQFTATTTLSPDQQKLLDLQEQLGINLGTLGVEQSKKLQGLLGTDFKLPGSPYTLPDTNVPTLNLPTGAMPTLNLNNDATESRLMELGRKRLDPLISQQRTSAEQDLFNRGIRPGSEAYKNAMTELDQSRNDAYNQLLLTGHGQAVSDAEAQYQAAMGGRQQGVSEAMNAYNAAMQGHNTRNQDYTTQYLQRIKDYLTQRSSPINEILALAGGAPVSYPQFQNTPGTQLPNVDYTGLVNQQYQQQLQNYQAGMGGLFGLGSSLIGIIPKLSDERTKTDIERVGETDGGTPIYTYRYKGSPMMEMGVMAQELERRQPEAVTTGPDGFKRVYYDKVA